MQKFSIFKHYWLFLLFSLVILIPGVYSLARYKVKPSIDFTGGSLWEIGMIKADQTELLPEEVKADIEQFIPVTSVQKTNQETFVIRSAEINSEKKQEIQAVLERKYPMFDEQRFESVGPVLGRELLVKTVIGILIVAIIIMIFLMRQFSELKYGLAAVLAMFHDTLILLSAFSLLGWWKGVEVDVLFVTAILTTLSFSVHDTIVVFDRIRELGHKHPNVKLSELASTAALQTVNRSINNSLTIILMLTSLVLLGGETLRWFAVALLIGSITGTYSSTFTAVPLMLLWEDIQTKLKKKTK